jgi:hypothetical protein
MAESRNHISGVRRSRDERGEASRQGDATCESSAGHAKLGSGSPRRETQTRRTDLEIGMNSVMVQH